MSTIPEGLGIELRLQNFSDAADVNLVAYDGPNPVRGRSGADPKRIPKPPEVKLDPGDAVPQRVVLAHVPFGLLGPAMKREQELTIANVRQDVVLDRKQQSVSRRKVQVIE